MKTSSTWNLRSTLGRTILGLVLVTMIGSISVVPAIGRDDHDRRDRDDRHYEHNRHGHDRDRHGHDRDRRVYDHSGYRGRGYAPPPVIYLPPPPPGIGIFFPPVFIPR